MLRTSSCRRTSFAIFGVLAFASWGLSLEAEAAPIKKVLGACDNTPGCSYSINDKTGDVSGCSTQSGKCFYCPNDGKRECIAVRRVPTGGQRPVPLNEGVTLTK